MAEFVRVHGDVDENTFHGEQDGYSYNFLESSPSGHMMYEVKDPDSSSKLVELDEKGLDELRGDPKAFWNKYINK